MVGQMLEEEEEEKEVRPPWLKPLLETTFFAHCNSHGDPSNMYCLDCARGALCSYCLLHHRDHRAIQIRRSSYHDVIRVSEIQKFLDITGVQTYIINSARVVFLNQRPQTRPGKGVANTCQICDRGILDAYRFCSLGCKLAGTQLNLGIKVSLQKKRQRNRRNNIDNSELKNKYRPEEMYSPAAPPSYRSNKRRKGIPHRAPLGG